MQSNSLYFKISGVLWITWSLFHILAGATTISFSLSGDTYFPLSLMTQAMDPSVLDMDYPAAADALVGQHGFNLLIAGVISFLCGFFVWNGNKYAIFLSALTGTIASLGYFLFFVLSGTSRFFPCTFLTILCFIAILLSMMGLKKDAKGAFSFTMK